jgi:hypothetical protein
LWPLALLDEIHGALKVLLGILPLIHDAHPPEARTNKTPVNLSSADGG